MGTLESPDLAMVEITSMSSHPEFIPGSAILPASAPLSGLEDHQGLPGVTLCDKESAQKSSLGPLLTVASGL